ncbi:MAG: hypothetical protein AAGG69_15995 [Pseudomonadota bacterium]
MVAAVIEEINVYSLAIGEWLLRRLGSFAALIGFCTLMAFTLTIAAAGWLFPINNWDMLAYLASAHEATGVTDPVALHAYAYETMRANISSGDFTVLTQDREYRIRQFTDPAAFNTMLGFYRVKLLYVEATAFLSGFVSGYAALKLMSVVPSLLIGAVLSWWLVRERAMHLAPLVIALLLAALFGDIAREGTPDAISSLTFIAAIFAFLARREGLVFGLLVLTFSARPDHLAYVGLLMVVSLVMKMPSWGTTAAFFVSLAAYIPMTKMGGHPGWWTHFYFTHVEFVPTLAGFDPDFSIVTYLKSQVRVIVRSLVEETWLAVMIIGAFAWWQMVLRGIHLAKRETCVLVTTVLAICAKMVVFPLHETRFWFAYLIVFGMVVICALRHLEFFKPAVRRVS